jgi:hypothetical protein
MKKGTFLIAALTLILYACLPVLAQPKPVDPLNWRDLAGFLGDIDGWQARGEVDGSTVNTGNFKMSVVTRNYNRDGVRLEIQITDGGYVPMAYAGFQAMSQFEIDNSDEYVKKTAIQGFTAIENYNYKRKKTTIMILVADRFMVQLEARETVDAKEIKAIAGKMDLKGLAALAK